MKSETEFRADVQAIIGFPPQESPNTYPSWVITTDWGQAEITLKPDTPAILFRFTIPSDPWGQHDRDVGVHMQTGHWDISASRGVPSASLARAYCVSQLQRRLAACGYRPPVAKSEEAPAGLAEDLRKIERLLGVLQRALPRRTIEDVRGLFEPAAGLHLSEIENLYLHAVLLQRAHNPGDRRAKGILEKMGHELTFDAPEAAGGALPVSPEEKELLAQVLKDESEQPHGYPAGGIHAAMVARRQATLKGLLGKLEAL